MSRRCRKRMASRRARRCVGPAIARGRAYADPSAGGRFLLDERLLHGWNGCRLPVRLLCPAVLCVPYAAGRGFAR